MKAENGLLSIIKLRSLFGTLREARAAAGMEVFGKKDLSSKRRFRRIVSKKI